MRIAHEHQTTVILDGQGADELLAGYQYYFPSYQLDLLDRGRVGRLVFDTVAFRRRLRRASERYANSQRRFNHNIALGPRALAAAWRRGSVAPATTTKVSRRPCEGCGFAARSRKRCSTTRCRCCCGTPTATLWRSRARPASRSSITNSSTCACASRIVRSCVTAGRSTSSGKGAARILPPEIRWRADKVGYAAPLDLWLRDSLRDWAHERLFKGAVLDLEGYDRPSLEDLWRRHQSGENNSWALWRWISLNEWFALLDSGLWQRGFASPEVRSAAAEAR